MFSCGASHWNWHQAGGRGGALSYDLKWGIGGNTYNLIYENQHFKKQKQASTACIPHFPMPEGSLQIKAS